MLTLRLSRTRRSVLGACPHRPVGGVGRLRRALEADPGDPTALGILGFYAITIRDEAEAGRWLARAALQPRMPPQQVARMTEASRQTFGHAWTPAGPRP